MTQVQIVPNPKTGAIVTPYQSNPKFGYVQLQQTAMVVDGGWIRENKRTALLRADVELLSKFVTGNKTLSLPGKIVVKEFLESQVPQTIAEKFFNKAVSHEEQIEPYLKRAGADGVQLTYGGERILRFSEYDPSGNDTDTRIAHDNIDAVREAIVSKSAVAQLGV